MLEGRTYVPLLHLRLAEVRALTELPEQIKNRILPVVRMRPWLTARSLDRAFEKIDEAFPARFYGFDLDHSRNLPDRDSAAYAEFRQLFDPANGFEAYYDRCLAQNYAIPVLRSEGGVVPEIGFQLDHVAAIDRGLIIRVDAESPISAAEVIASCDARGIHERLTVIDGGWTRDLLTRAAICTNLAQAVVAADPEAEVVIGGSSFPMDFAKKGDHFSLAAYERPLFNEVRRHLNAGRIVYGDWASTRPPSDPVPMTNVPRIDSAGSTAWECWRSVDGETYQQIAARARTDLDLDDQPDVWGEYMIVSTAAGIEPSIKSPAMAAAARINLHMLTQATFDDALTIEDEPVGDDL